MAKERKQIPVQPEENDLEKHVREMLDITVPDVPEPTKTAPKVVKKPLAITVVDHTGTPPPEPASPALDEAIAATNEQLVAQAVTAPLIPEPEPKKPTKVAITHIEEPETPVVLPLEIVTESEEAAPEPELVAEASEAAEEAPKTVQEAMDEAGEIPEEDASPLEAEIESTATDEAVSDIIAHESDELLAVQDSKLQAAAPPRKKGGVRAFFSAWAHSSAARWATFLILFGALVAAGIVPQSRYYVLNKAGVRSSASVVITDASTLRPLKNVTISLAGQSVKTDAEGKAQLQQLPLGPSELVITKRAFAEQRKAVTVGWGSNPLGDVALIPQGNQYTFIVTDVFSGKPVPLAEAVVQDQAATAGDDGVIKLTLDETEADSVDVSIKAEGYRDETLTLDLTTKEDTPVVMTPSGRVAFVSKRSGTYDVYTIDVDGKNEKLTLPGTGSESDELVFAQHPTQEFAILVSNRDGKRAANGVSISNLLTINLQDGTTKSIIESPQIRLVGWIGSRMIYVQLVADATAEDPARYKLMSYDHASGDNRQLAATNYFNDIIIAGSRVYYAPASAYQNGVNLGVFVVNADGSGKKPIFDKESWNMYRTSYDHIALAVQQDWYDYLVGAEKPEKLAGQPSNTISRVYSDSPNGKQSIWVDSRDGKGTLVAYTTAAKSESTIYAQSGIKGPIRWINNTTLVYVVSTDTETAQYVISTQGGEPKKLANVTDVAGIDRWSY